MTKEEIALQLTLARIDKIMHTKFSSSQDIDMNIDYNEMLANETVKMFNTIYNGIDVINKD